MLTEELGQVYQAMAPVPLWFRYLVTYQEVDDFTGLTLGVLLALVYLILKVTLRITWPLHFLPSSKKNLPSNLTWIFSPAAALRTLWTMGAFSENFEVISQRRGIVRLSKLLVTLPKV